MPLRNPRIHDLPSPFIATYTRKHCTTWGAGWSPLIQVSNLYKNLQKYQPPIDLQLLGGLEHEFYDFP